MKNRKKKVIKSAAAVTMIAATMSLTSCEFMAAFADGMAQGMASYNYYNPYGYDSYNSFDANNSSYPLNSYASWNQAQPIVPLQQQDLYNYAVQVWNDVERQQQQQQQVLYNYAVQVWNDVERQQQELHDNIKNASKQYGFELTEEEILEIMNEANKAYLNEINGTSSLSNSSSNPSGYQGQTSSSQYENMYRKWERIAEGCINNGISGESSPTAACLQNKQTLLDAQKQMKRIRSEAAQNGVYIQQSRWETATGGY